MMNLWERRSTTKNSFDLYTEWEAADFPAEGPAPVGGVPEGEADLPSEEEEETEAEAESESESESESDSKGKKRVSAFITMDTLF